ncbi:hypothetical protein AVEN_164113-1 [Araneus ventricosus]|uniref:Uncharacterized protein n=1 Tax=Araneus ventricosus TaxID=182803 RepID=A0A4Y2CZX6_ARAVE|nr:hypothetical protein AVEN_164113-1 [Araneus ventricosus]
MQNIPGKTASHIPCGYAYLIIGPNGLPLKPVTVYRGSDAVDHFITSIVKEKDILAAKLRTITPMQMTIRDLEEFQKATHCNLCKKWLGKDRVRDHDHLSGKYRQALHNNMEKHISFSIRRKENPVILQFIDSFQFLNLPSRNWSKIWIRTSFPSCKAAFLLRIGI